MTKIFLLLNDYNFIYKIGKPLKGRIRKDIKRLKKTFKNKASMMEYYGSVGVPMSTLKKDLHSVIKYKNRFYFSKSRFNQFIKDLASNEDDHSISGYAFYGEKEMIKKAKTELNKLDIKLKKETIVKKTFTKKLPTRAMKTLHSMIDY